MGQDGQYATDQLDTVQHPVLGELKFPKEMPFEERNQHIQDALGDDLSKESLPGGTERLAKAAQNIPAARAQTRPTAFEQEHSNSGGAWPAIKRSLPGLFADPNASREELANVKPEIDALENKPAPAPVDSSWGMGERVRRGWKAGGDVGQDPVNRTITAGAYAAGPFVGVDPKETERMADVGDTGGIEGQAAVPAALAVAPLAIEGGLRGGMRAGRALGEGVDKFRQSSGLEKTGQGLGVATGDAATELAKRPMRTAANQKAVKASQDLDVAKADLAKIERNTPVRGWLRAGRDSTATFERAQNILDYAENMWQEGHEEPVARHPNNPVDHEALVRAGQEAMTPEMIDASNDPQADKASVDRWIDSALNKPRNLQSLDNFLRELNADTKTARANPAENRLLMNVKVKVADAARGEIERVLTNAGEQGVRDVNRRWGALQNVGDRAVRLAERQAGSEGKKGIVPDWAHVYLFTHGGGIGPSLGVGLRVAEMTKPTQGSQLATGMTRLAKSKLEPGSVGAPPPAPHGLLPAPPPEPVGLPINATPDASSVRAREPQSNIQRGPGGRMRRIYTGENKPEPVGHTAEGGPMYEPVAPTPRVERPTERRNVVNEANYAGRERRSIRDVQGPEPMRLGLRQHWEKILDDPMATSRDKAIARERLDDMKEHPFERHEGGDINSMKGDRRVSREKAEANTAKRSEGRNSRFKGSRRPKK